jgi:two-component system, chemotaxis family, chemotaxis protein CheY
MKIMIVDDSYFVRMKIKNALANHKDFFIIEAENGEEAVSNFLKEQPEIILLDINMPVKDGLEALKEIRNINKTVKIIMLTAEAEQSAVMSALADGADNYLIKPFDDDSLLDSLKSLN